jgi:hypothetical protein
MQGLINYDTHAFLPEENFKKFIKGIKPRKSKVNTFNNLKKGYHFAYFLTLFS